MHHLTASGVKFSLVRFTSTKAEVKCTSFLNLSNHRCQNGVLEYLLSSSVLPSLIPQFCKKVPVFECSNACNELTVRLMQVIFNQQNGNVESCTQLLLFKPIIEEPTEKRPQELDSLVIEETTADVIGKQVRLEEVQTQVPDINIIFIVRLPIPPKGRNHSI